LRTGPFKGCGRKERRFTGPLSSEWSTRRQSRPDYGLGLSHFLGNEKSHLTLFKWFLSRSAAGREGLSHRKCSSCRFAKVDPAQIRQLIPYISNDEGKVDGFVRELILAKGLEKHSL
jgi:hypothetical protein